MAAMGGITTIPPASFYPHTPKLTETILAILKTMPPAPVAPRQDAKTYALLFAVLIFIVAIIFVLWKERIFLFSAAGHLDLQGTIYLSLVPNPESENHLSVYAFDAHTRTLAPFLSGTSTDYLTSAFSSDKSMLAFSTLSSSTDLYIKNIPSDTEIRLTNDPSLKIRRNPTWSPDGTKLAYVAKTDLSGGDSTINKWQVELYDLKTSQERFVDYGTNPMFAPNGTLLVLESDGLYQFDLSAFDSGSFSKTKIWDTGSEDSAANMKLALSRNGQYLAWGVPERDQVVILKISAWEPFTAMVMTTIPSTAFWPVFSPDSRYLAFEEVDRKTLGNPRIVVRDLETGAQERVFDLNSFAQDALFMTDWQ